MTPTLVGIASRKSTISHEVRKSIIFQATSPLLDGFWDTLAMWAHSVVGVGIVKFNAATVTHHFLGSKHNASSRDFGEYNSSKWRSKGASGCVRACLDGCHAMDEEEKLFARAHLPWLPDYPDEAAFRHEYTQLFRPSCGWNGCIRCHRSEALNISKFKS